jgi:hypothetical protein
MRVNARLYLLSEGTVLVGGWGTICLYHTSDTVPTTPTQANKGRQKCLPMTITSVADPGPACNFDADPESDPSIQIKAQNLEKVLK